MIDYQRTWHDEQQHQFDQLLARDEARRSAGVIVFLGGCVWGAFVLQSLHWIWEAIS